MFIKNELHHLTTLHQMVAGNELDLKTNTFGVET